MPRTAMTAGLDPSACASPLTATRGARGALPERAGVGHRARGLQRRRRGLGVVPARPRPLARLPLERGRAGRHLRHPSAAVPGVGVLERPRPDPEGADLRADRAEGNHGEDAKEYWWYLDSTPTHSWMRWRYHYPQRAFPYDDLVGRERAAAARRAGVRAARHGRLRRPLLGHHRRLRQGGARRPLRPRPRSNAGPDAATLHVLPTLWFRNTWTWGPTVAGPSSCAPTAARSSPSTTCSARCARAARRAGARCSARTRRTRRASGACRRRRTRRTASATTSSHGTPTVNPAQRGHEGGALVPAARGGRRDRRDARCACADARRPRRRVGGDATDRASARPTSGTPSSRPPRRAEEARVMRQAFAGMLWSKQLYHYDVDRWLHGDPGQPLPPPSAWRPQRASGAT